MLPPPSELQPRIDRITEWLVATATGATAVPPSDWADDDWRYARVIAHIHGIAPLLHAQGAGVLGDSRWCDFLGAQHALNTQRNLRIRELSTRILRHAFELRAPVVPLKGVALLARLYDDIGLRPMADVDLFTTETHASVIEGCLIAAGLCMLEGGNRHRTFASPPNQIVDFFGEHPDNPIKVELHTQLAEHLPRELCDLTPIFARFCGPDAVADALPAPDPLDHVLHALLHGSYHMMSRSLRFVGLRELHLLLVALVPGDWEALLRTLARIDGLWWAHPPLMLVQRYFPGDVPGDVLATTARSAPARLRDAMIKTSIASVSHCNISPRYAGHVLKWARHPADAALYVFERLSGRGRVGWQTSNRWSRQVQAFAPTQHVFRRAVRWLNPRALRAGAEQMFG
jgi:hypothetical protein